MKIGQPGEQKKVVVSFRLCNNFAVYYSSRFEYLRRSVAVVAAVLGYVYNPVVSKYNKISSLVTLYSHDPWAIAAVPCSYRKCFGQINEAIDSFRAGADVLLHTALFAYSPDFRFTALE